MSSDYDVIVIGAGHNGLVCGAYLAQAGERVLVLERYSEPGGCVATVEMPGYPGTAADVGGMEHGVFANSPAMRELKLADFGLRYLQRDHIYTFPFVEGDSWILHKDRAKSVQSIAAFSGKDAAAFEQFADFSAAILTLIGAIGDRPPPDLAELASLAKVGGKGAGAIMQTFLSSPKQVVERWFEHDHLRAGLINYASHAQTPPWQLGSGYAPSLALGGQGQGGQRPQGGGVALVRALVGCLEHYGGVVRCGQPVHRILVHNRRAVGVELANGERLTARRAVISAIDARRVFTDLIDATHMPPSFRQAMSQLTSSRDNIGELSMACVLSELPRFTDATIGADALLGSFWQSGSQHDVEETFIDIRRGVLPERPNVMWAVPTVLDPSRAPNGLHLLWLAAFVPYTFRDGRTWDEVKYEAADRFLNTIGAVAPNVPGSVQARLIVSPLDWQQRTGNLHGNADHLDTGIDQMLGNRPHPSIAHYRTPIRGLYLTGAGTHPGGGITGGPGRNTARVVLGDLGLLERPSLKDVAARADRLRSVAAALFALRRHI